MKENTLYLPGLNGLRAVAALSVVLTHISQKGIAEFGLLKTFSFPIAGFGVTLFFVISGFLITYLLLMELNKNKEIDIKKFYIRRILRIWPIYYLFIVICIGTFVILGRQKEIFIKEIWFYLFFAANVPFIFQQGILILVHYWSIGVEEQYYLFWPLIVKISKNYLLKVSILIFIVLFLAKVLLWWYLGTSSFEYRLISITRFHCILIGGIGAILNFNKQIYFIKLFSNKFVQLLSWFMFLTLGLNIIYLPSVFSQEVFSVAGLSMIMGQITANKRIINLDNRFCDFIGKISYGIYVIHPLIILILSRLFSNLNLDIKIRYVLVYSSVVSVTVLVAWLSYTYFEKPFLKLKSKYALVQSSNSMLSK